MPQDQKRRQRKLAKKRQKDKMKKKRASQQGNVGERGRAVRVIRGARQYPIHECLINREWREQGLATILLVRQQPNALIVFGIYLADMRCLGLKNAICNANVRMAEYKNEMRPGFVENNDAVACPVPLAHQIIYGALDYAEDLGFKPHRDFGLARHILEEREAFEPYPDLEFGQDGKPLFISGPDDNVSKIVKHLEETVGEGNFHYMIGGPAIFDDDDGPFIEDGDEDYLEEYEEE